MNVEEGNVQGHEAQEAAHDEEHVWSFFESRPVDHLAALCWTDAYFHDDVGDDLGGENDECDDACCPAESDSRF